MADARKNMTQEALTVASHLGIAAIISMALGIVLRLIIPRALDPEKMGVFYFAESMGSIFFTFLPLGISSYIVREVAPNPAHAKEILATLSRAQLYFALVLMLLLAGVIALTGANQLTLWTCVIMGVFSGCYYYQRAILRRTYIVLGHAKSMAKIEVSIRIMLVLFVIAVLIVDASVLSIALCYAVSEIISLGILLYKSHKDKLLTGAFDQRLLKKIVLVSLPYFAIGVLVDFYGNIDVIILRYFNSDVEAGLYGVAAKLKGMGLLLIPVMQAAIQPILARAWHIDKNAFADFVDKTLRLLVVLSLPIAVVMMLVPDFFSDFLFGPKYQSSYRVISYLAPVLLLTYLNVLMGSCLNIISDGKKFLWVTFLSLCLNVVLTIIAVRIFSSYLGVGGGASGAAIATIISECFVLLSMRRIFPIGISHKKLFSTLALSLIPCLFLGLFFDKLLVISVGLRLSLGMIVLFLYMLIFRITNLEEIKNILTFVLRFKREKI